jgi:hypothetical protein
LKAKAEKLTVMWQWEFEAAEEWRHVKKTSRKAIFKESILNYFQNKSKNML